MFRSARATARPGRRTLDDDHVVSSTTVFPLHKRTLRGSLPTGHAAGPECAAGGLGGVGCALLWTCVRRLPVLELPESPSKPATASYKRARTDAQGLQTWAQSVLCTCGHSTAQQGQMAEPSRSSHGAVSFRRRCYSCPQPIYSVLPPQRRVGGHG
jgi:hypothetical protein